MSGREDWVCLGFNNPVGTGECWTCVCFAVMWVVSG